MKKITFILLFLFTFIASAQTFPGATGAIPDNNCDVTNEFTATVVGVGVLGPGGNGIDEVVLNITHTFDGDLDIVLFAPDGTSIELSTDNGGSGDNYIDTHFRSDAATSITAGTVPFTGNFLPEGSFANFNGVDADGDWILQVCDDFVGDTGTVDSWEITFAPYVAPNDEPGGAIPLTVGAVFADNAVVDSNAGATASEVADPTIPAPGCASYSGADMWYSVVVPAGGNITIETNSEGGSTLTDTGMAVYSGAIGAFVLEECDDDDSADGLFSLISLTGRTPGETLYVRIWEFGGDTEDAYQVSAYNPPPANDDTAGAVALTVGTAFTDNPVVGTNVSATDSEIADPTIPAPGCGGYSGGDVWYSVVVPASGNLSIGTDEETGSALTDSGIAVYSGPVGAFVLEDCDDTGGPGSFSRVDLTGQTPGATLFIRVWEGGNNSFGAFQISAWEIPLINDDTAGAVALTVGTAFIDNAVVGTNVGATDSEIADPTIPAPGCAGYSGGDVWYSVVVPASGNIIIGTDEETGSPIADTGVAVYSGPVGAFVLEDCDDTGGPGVFSRIELTGQTPGATLFIRVWEDGNNVPGEFQVSAWDPPAATNDDPATVTALTVGANFADQAIVGTNVGATDSEVADPTIPAPGCASYSGGDVWFSVVVPSTGRITVETNSEGGSTLADTGMAVYSGPVGAFVLEECDDDDSADGLFSLITFTGRTPGETLYIRVWEFGNNVFDSFQISAYNPPPANDDPAGAIGLTVGTAFADNAVVGDNIGATASEVTDPTITAPGCASYQGADVWFTVVVPADGNVNIETNSNASSLTDTGMAVYSGPIGALVLEECDDDDSADGLFSLISLSGRTPGETLYIRVWEFGGNVEDTFQVSVWNPVLSAEDITIEGFNYYPNPVRDVLNLNAVTPISNISVYSISGKEVMRVTPNVSELSLDMATLPSGMYLVRVIIDDKAKTFKVVKE